MVGPADPFVLGEGPDACLLLHGLTGSPAEMRPVGEALAAAGFRAVGPLLPGHGTTPEDLDITTRADLVQAAESALLSLEGARRIFLCGLSVGGLLAIHLAARPWVREGLPTSRRWRCLRRRSSSRGRPGSSQTSSGACPRCP